MDKVVYAKYNRTRVPEYQTVTKIVSQNGIMRVVKEALTKEAYPHILSMHSKYNNLLPLYKMIRPVECHIEDEKVIFDYYDGESVADIIEKDMKSLDEVINNIEKYIDIIFQFNDESIIKFKSDETFENIFGKIEDLDGVPAIYGLDIDLILDNILYIGDDNYICIDYEWYIDCVIPISFVKYRTLFYFYAKNCAYFNEKMDVTSFLKHFGIEEKMQIIYKNMDDSFQQMVHGIDWVNIYTRNYEKKVHPLKAMMHRYSDIEGIMIEKDHDIEALNAALSQKNIEISKKTDDIERMRYDYQVLMEKKALAIRDKDYEISEYRKIIDEKEEEVKCLRLLNDNLEKKLKANEGVIEEITNSVSWKLTSPIRDILDMIKGKR